MRWAARATSCTGDSARPAITQPSSEPKMMATGITAANFQVVSRNVRSLS